MLDVCTYQFISHQRKSIGVCDLSWSKEFQIFVNLPIVSIDKIEIKLTKFNRKITSMLESGLFYSSCDSYLLKYFLGFIIISN